MNLVPVENKILGIRPERIRLENDGTSRELTVRTTALEFIGHEWLAHGTVHNVPMILRSTEKPELEIGCDMTWYAPESAIRWFPSQQR